MGLALLVSTKQVLQGKARNSLLLSFPFPVQELEGGTDKKLPLIAFEAAYPSLYFACSPLAMHSETLTMKTHPCARREQPLPSWSRRKGGRTWMCGPGPPSLLSSVLSIIWSLRISLVLCFSGPRWEVPKERTWCVECSSPPAFCLCGLDGWIFPMSEIETHFF